MECANQMVLLVASVASTAQRPCNPKPYTLNPKLLYIRTLELGPIEVRTLNE